MSQEEVLSLQSAYRYLQLPAGLHNHEPFSQLVQRATSRVQAEFDDLDAVWMNESLQASFLKLPLAALLVGSVLQSVSWQTKFKNAFSVNIVSAPRCAAQATFDLYLCLVNVWVCKHAVSLLGQC